jgi:hypothetical protein
VKITISDADYLASVCRSWLGAPEGSKEERGLDIVLGDACDRLGVDRDELVERIVGVSAVVRETE